MQTHHKAVTPSSFRIVLTESSTPLYLEMCDDCTCMVRIRRHHTSICTCKTNMFDGLLLQLEAYLEDIQRAREQPSQSTGHCSGHQSIIHPLLASNWDKETPTAYTVQHTVQSTAHVGSGKTPATPPGTPTHCIVRRASFVVLVFRLCCLFENGI